MKYRKVSIVQVKNKVRKEGRFVGFAVGNKVHPSHFFSGWCLAQDVVFENIDEIDKAKNKMLYYLDRQLGNNIVFYEYIK